ncbi:MAG TPA: hypothetical protein VEH04_04930 [Verrucomicrobiae bacterium]|nr:hypothetical protein [Verrucomicrobiae bacterium]
MKTHQDVVKRFGQKLATLLMLRSALQWIAVWLFLWGAIVLGLRFARLGDARDLAWGLAAALPVGIVAAIRAYRRRVSTGNIRAAYDGLNQCGGVIMASEVADTSPWGNELPAAASPRVHWRCGRAFGLLGLSAAFAALALLLPDRLTASARPKSLEIGQLVGELQAEVETLKEENVLEEEKAEDLQKQLTMLHEKSSAIDPNKTWEALDHIKDSNADLAQQAAEEMISKTRSLTEAETLANALQMADQGGLSPEAATRFAQELAAMLKSAKLEEGLINGTIPPELLNALESFKREDLEKLMAAIQFNKSSFGKAMTNFAKLRLIDAKSLAQCKSAGQCLNPQALAAFLCENTNASACSATLSFCYGNGGVTRGRGDAPMTWKDESGEQGAKFKEEALPMSDRFADSKFVGISRTAPELSGEEVVAGKGALAGASAAGGAAHSQVVLPRHKQTVQEFFKRKE